MTSFRFVCVGLLSLLLIGCAGETSSPLITNPNSAASALAPGQGIDVSNASLADCPAGGKTYAVYSDENHDGRKQDEESVLSTQVVCNGTNGASGSNGSNGTNGSNGSNGSNGHSLVFTTVSAPPEVCASGGSTLLIASDIHDLGIYDPTLPNQSAMTVCNGSNGQNAEVPSYTPVEAIQPCGATVAYKEVLLRLANGQVLGSFSDDVSGKMTDSRSYRTAPIWTPIKVAAYSVSQRRIRKRAPSAGSIKSSCSGRSTIDWFLRGR